MAKPTQKQLDRLIVDELLKTAVELGVEIRELSADEVRLLRSDLSDAFSKSEYLLTFETMADKSSLQDEEGWSLMGEFLRAGPHVIFYDAPGDFDQAGVEVRDGRDIPNLIGECNVGFPYYVTDDKRTFVLGFNQHDYLIGVGSAANWIDSLKARRSTE